MCPPPTSSSSSSDEGETALLPRHLHLPPSHTPHLVMRMEHPASISALTMCTMVVVLPVPGIPSTSA